MISADVGPLPSKLPHAIARWLLMRLTVYFMAALIAGQAFIGLAGLGRGGEWIIAVLACELFCGAWMAAHVHGSYRLNLATTRKHAVLPSRRSDAGERKSSLAEAEKIARDRVDAWAASAAAVGWVPGSMISLASNEVELGRELARCFGVDDHDIEAVSAALRSSMTHKMAAGEILSFVPVVGWAAKAAIFQRVSKDFGEALISYFKTRSPYV